MYVGWVVSVDTPCTSTLLILHVFSTLLFVLEISERRQSSVQRVKKIINQTGPKRFMKASAS